MRSACASLDAELVILDVDGTLIDSNYRHVLAWHMAFSEYDQRVEAWRTHRHVGMGGDQLVESVATSQQSHLPPPPRPAERADPPR